MEEKTVFIHFFSDHESNKSSLDKQLKTRKCIKSKTGIVHKLTVHLFNKYAWSSDFSLPALLWLGR
jgi:hypothetical protein